MHVAAAETQLHNGQVTTSRIANTPGVFLCPGQYLGRCRPQLACQRLCPFLWRYLRLPHRSRQSTHLDPLCQRYPKRSCGFSVCSCTTHKSTTPREYRCHHPFYWAVNSNASGRVHLSWGANHSLQNLSRSVRQSPPLGFDGSQWVALDTGLDNKHFYFKDAVDEASGSLHNTGTIDLYALVLCPRISKILDGSNILISQAFTPNGDGINDTWFIQGIENYPNAQIWVYNRWGQQVFHKRGGYQNDWGVIIKTIPILCLRVLICISSTGKAMAVRTKWMDLYQ